MHTRLAPSPRRNKENLFTGWTDVDLSETGVQEAKDAGKVRCAPLLDGGRG